MIKYAFKATNEKKSAKLYGSNIDISTKDAIVLCRQINRKPLAKGRDLLGRLIEQKSSLEGKYYTKAATEMLSLLNSAEKNAEFKGLDAEKLIIFASAHKGLIYFRPRRFRLRRQRKKMTNVQIVLVER
jgi:large subunit ribosomal protein L22